MTEKTRLLKSAIDEIDRVLLGNKSPDVNKVYLNNAKRYIEDSMQDHHPAFAVGEYYTDDVFIYKIRRVNPNSLKVDYLNKQTGDFVVNEHWSLWIPTPEPATAGQIATFCLAEHFASKGRKLDEFAYGDEAEICGITKTVIDIDDSHVTFSDGTVIKKDNQALKLIQTAEELQEVGESQ